MMRTSLVDSALTRATALWFLAALLGQWAFLYYLVGFYGASTLMGDFEAWSKNTMVPIGYVSGDTLGNLVFASHVLIAMVVVFGGVLQLIPALRERWPVVHRWNGRVFFTAATLAAFGGLYLVWFRTEPKHWISAIAISGNAALIFVCACFAWWRARTRDVRAHRRWALRAFIVANGVWFFRVGVFAWIVLNQGPAGMTKDLNGPFDLFWAFASYLLPLAVLEIYLRVEEGATLPYRIAMSVASVAIVLVMGVGAVGLSSVLFRFI